MGIRQIDLLQGTLELLILKSLSAGANHGYGIATRIHQLSDAVLKVEEGSLYPAALVVLPWLTRCCSVWSPPTLTYWTVLTLLGVVAALAS